MQLVRVGKGDCLSSVGNRPYISSDIYLKMRLAVTAYVRPVGPSTEKSGSCEPL